jgi:NMD protein affecting ribosome stability and mRNA decay
MENKAEWVRATEYSQSFCSVCRLTPKTIFGMLPPYCPNCGEKMNNNSWVENKEGKLIQKGVCHENKKNK